MNKRMLIVPVAVFLTAATALAQVGLPPGKWWKTPRVVERLQITPEQQSKLDRVFLSSASELIDLKAEVEKRSLELRAQLERNDLDREKIQSAADGVNQARAAQFARELMMLVDMRAVLTDQQWTLLRRALDERNADRRDRRPGGDQPQPPRNRRDQ